MKKVLIITYYWPPAGGPGVQRVLKFAKYLPAFGWQPIILTVKNGEYPAIDETLEEDIPEVCKVYKTKSFEPNLLYKKFVGMNSTDKIPVAVLAEENQNWKKRIANWIRLNLVIPDAKIGWIPFAVKKGKKIIKSEKPDIIFSSSPPPTVHLVAQKLAKWSRIKWIADFRDPWTKIYYYDKSRKSKYSLLLDQKFEIQVVESADNLITVSSSISNLFSHYKQKNFKIIPNGYDEDDFRSLNRTKKFDKFTLTYAGKINNQQNPKNLWIALRQLIESYNNFTENFQMLLMSNITGDVSEKIKKNNIEDYCKFLGYVEHKKMIENIFQSDVLLLLIPDTQNNEGIVTGKLFEYLVTGRFILGIGPKNGDAAKILKETQTGIMVDYDNEDKLTNILKAKYDEWQKHGRVTVNQKHIKKYSRYNLTKELVNVFEDVSNRNT